MSERGRKRKPEIRREKRQVQRREKPEERPVLKN
jgi:hypothetical protein